jgi:hypothetical protein
MLVALTDRDIGLVDLEDANAPGITVPLSDSAERLAPFGIAVSDGDPAVADDALIAIQLAASQDVVILRFQNPSAGASGAHPFEVVPNKVPVGGLATDIGFVRTDGGLRLAALVPSRSAIALVDPDRGLSSEVPLGAAFDRMSIEPSPDGVGDIAIVWSTSSATLGLVALGDSIGKPYRSVDTISLSSYVEAMHDVPNVGSQKLLTLAGGSEFVVLDLVARTASPLISTSGAEVNLSPDGERAIIYVPGSSSLGVVDLNVKSPANLLLSYPVSGAFDIARRDGGRAVFALHQRGGVSMTLLDGRAPSLTTAREYLDVLLGGF